MTDPTVASNLAWRGEVDRALAPLMCAVAHDLRAPLNALGLNLTLVRRMLDDPAAARRWLGVAEDETHNLQALLDAHLRLITAAEVEPEPRSSDLGTMLRWSEPLLRCLADRRRIELETEPVPASGVWPENAMYRGVTAIAVLAIEQAENRVRLASAPLKEGGTRFEITGVASLETERIERLIAPLRGRLHDTSIHFTDWEI